MRRVLQITAGAFFLVWTVYFTMLLGRTVYFATASQSWRPVSARVRSIEIHSKYARLHYEYSVGGQAYQGDTFSFLSSGTLTDKRTIRGDYSRGQKITVHVDPRDPSRSVVLVRRLSLTYLAMHRKPQITRLSKMHPE